VSAESYTACIAVTPANRLALVNARSCRNVDRSAKRKRQEGSQQGEIHFKVVLER